MSDKLKFDEIRDIIFNESIYRLLRELSGNVFGVKGRGISKYCGQLKYVN